jgi:hypothetical protein
MSGLDTEHKVLPNNLKIETSYSCWRSKSTSCNTQLFFGMRGIDATSAIHRALFAREQLGASIAALRAYGNFGKLFLAGMVPQHKDSARPYPCSCIRAARRFAPLKEKLFARIFAQNKNIHSFNAGIRGVPRNFRNRRGSQTRNVGGSTTKLTPGTDVDVTGTDVDVI